MLHHGTDGLWDCWAPELRASALDPTADGGLENLKEAIRFTPEIWCEIGLMPPIPSDTPPVKDGYSAARLGIVDVQFDWQSRPPFY